MHCTYRFTELLPFRLHCIQHYILYFCELQLVQEATEVNTETFQISTYLLLFLGFVLARSYSFVFVSHFGFIFFTNSLILNLNYNHTISMHVCTFGLSPLALSSFPTSCPFSFSSGSNSSCFAAQCSTEPAISLVYPCHSALI